MAARFGSSTPARFRDPSSTPVLPGAGPRWSACWHVLRSVLSAVLAGAVHRTARQHTAALQHSPPDLKASPQRSAAIAAIAAIDNPPNRRTPMEART